METYKEVGFNGSFVMDYTLRFPESGAGWGADSLCSRLHTCHDPGRVWILDLHGLTKVSSEKELRTLECLRTLKSTE